ncbi:MAG: histidinol-phosphate transaminase, partial [Hyphomicrobiales bacterium]|nr:histidinol-phosphate transaminase [Hyphomicrobiales bacterium]
FLLIHFPTEPGKTAKDADAFLSRRGLILRTLGAYNLPNALRLTIGSEEANHKVVETLGKFLSEAVPARG